MHHAMWGVALPFSKGGGGAMHVVVGAVSTATFMCVCNPDSVLL
jgi:hypothetical protein